MDNYEKLYSLLLNDSDGLLISLRFGQEISFDKVNQILSVLSDINDEYKKSDMISKNICGLFMDFFPAIESSFSLYSSEQIHEIIEISDKIQDAMRACLFN